MTNNELQIFLEKKLPHATIILEGESCQLTLTVIASFFHQQSELKRQQMIFSHINTLVMDGTIHAISMNLFTPEEWQQHNTE